MIVKNNQIARIATLFSKIVIPQSASVATIVNITKVLEELPKIEKSFHEVTKKLFASYNIELKGNKYEFTDHEKAVEITEKYSELAQLETTIAVSFVKDSYLSLAVGLTGAEVLYLKQLLS